MEISTEHPMTIEERMRRDGNILQDACTYASCFHSNIKREREDDDGRKSTGWDRIYISSVINHFQSTYQRIGRKTRL